MPLHRWYLAIGGVLLALYLLVPPFQGSPVLINFLSGSSAVAIVVGVRRNRPVTRLAVAAVRARAGAVLPRGRLHLPVSEAARPRGSVPVDRRRAVPRHVPGADGRRPDHRAPQEPGGRPGGRDRRAHHHRRRRPALVVLPDGAVRPRRHALAPREERLDRVPARRRPPARRGPAAGVRRGSPPGIVLPARRGRADAVRDGRRLRLCTARRQLQPPADLRRRLDQLLPAVGLGRAEPDDAQPGRADARSRTAALTLAARAPDDRVGDGAGDRDRARVPYRGRRPARDHGGLDAAVPARDRARGRARAAARARRLARACPAQRGGCPGVRLDVGGDPRSCARDGDHPRRRGRRGAPVPRDPDRCRALHRRRAADRRLRGGRARVGRRLELRRAAGPRLASPARRAGRCGVRDRVPDRCRQSPSRADRGRVVGAVVAADRRRRCSRSPTACRSHSAAPS